MANKRKIMGWVGIGILVASQIHSAIGISWGSSARKLDLVRAGHVQQSATRSSLSQALQSGSRLPNSYELALGELRELESEPLCHRTAARLLVNSCEVLESKNEATVLTDSGRKIRDFIDSYAASLAICDLERGSFDIPTECDHFREPALNQLPLQNSGQLHNTWVNYRHKALRFCEAARADNQKAQQIFLFERLTKIMGRFTDDVDKQFEQHLTSLGIRAQATGDRIDELSPKVDHLNAMLKSVEELFLGQLIQEVKETTELVNSGTQNALNLQRMLGVMFKGVLEGQAEVAATYERSIEVANQRVESAMDTAMQVMVLATESAVNLQTQLESSRLQAMELETRQNNLEEGMQRLVGVSETLATEYYDHANHLRRAQNITNGILGSLEDTAASAIHVKNSVLRQSFSSWWPYIWCPAASLVLGSYGLPPSSTRNLGLLVLGEAAGFTLSLLQSYSPDLSFISSLGFYSLQLGITG
ncbi:uncharacterized protein GGS22DRAFT_185231 [Annulohypoxylon maeteangense]|uniref:uncharacterized protein n=1 Tax=Annulohypoxylon maeteangense TaxID=1927788 RepID=UPI0020077944|nr:uncharacterized protein GGS22DRAFT_185231 [Annulohypoxylon maeteangense]KAI0887851.1 hypothetical protein GGS22DRAFT_185231 [Annulohypoxylon maeteangense]